MSRTITCFIILVSLLVKIELIAQSTHEQYEFGFDFVEGIYLTYEEFKNNDPAIKEKNVIAVKPPEDQVKFSDYNRRIIKYIDINGAVQEMKISKIWGVCSEDIVYIELGNKLHRLIKIGAITYLIENHKGTLTTYPILGLNGYTPGQIKNPFGNFNRIFYFQTGEVVPLTPENLVEIFLTDSTIFSEYAGLESKDREKLMLRYLDKFNERNPIHFPLNNEKVFNTDQAVEVKFD